MVLVNEVVDFAIVVGQKKRLRYLIGLAVVLLLTLTSRYRLSWEEVQLLPARQRTRTKNTTASFNYTAYWAQASKAANASFESTRSSPAATQPKRPCPKVYVYDLPPFLIDSDLPRNREWNSSLIEQVFGPPAEMRNLAIAKVMCQGCLRYTNQYAFPEILEYRLRVSKDCATKDPKKADLFYAPILTGTKPQGYMWRQQCANVSGASVAAALTHLTAATVHRHFFAIGKGHYAARSCPGWWSSPIPALVPVRRLAYSHMDFSSGNKSNPVRVRRDLNKTQQVFPHLFSVPYPSGVHLNPSVQLSDIITPTTKGHHNKRTLLMLFLGDNHGDWLVRQRITEVCKEYNQKAKNICTAHSWSGDGLAAELKATAKFCLEPVGDSPFRKSLSDSIVMGCIPVLFSDLTDEVAPWFWGAWKDRGRVLVSREAFLAGEIDLKELLQSIPPHLLQVMQTTLLENARKFQYSTEDDDDGVRVILDALVRDSSNLRPSQRRHY